MTSALITDLTRIINSLPNGRHRLEVITGATSAVVECSGAVSGLDLDPWTPADIADLYNQLDLLDQEPAAGELSVTSEIFREGVNTTLVSTSRWDAASGHFLQESVDVSKVQVTYLPPREVSEEEFDRIMAGKRARFQTHVS